jgi:hypothetical protein
MIRKQITMKSQSKFIKDALIRFALTYFACILIGFLFYQFQIFDIKSPKFDFVHFGALAAIFFTMLQTTSVRNSVSAYIFLSILSQAFLPKSDELYFSLFWNITEHIVLGIAIYLYWKLFYSVNKAMKIRSLLLAPIIVIGWIIISTAIRVYTNWYEGFSHLIYYDIQFGLLFGFGLGLGIESGNLLLKPKEISKPAG